MELHGGLVFPLDPPGEIQGRRVRIRVETTRDSWQHIDFQNTMVVSRRSIVVLCFARAPCIGQPARARKKSTHAGAPAPAFVSPRRRTLRDFT